MAANDPSKQDHYLELLNRIQVTLQSIQQDYHHLSTTVASIEGRVNVLAGVKKLQDAAEKSSLTANGAKAIQTHLATEDVVSMESAAPLPSTTLVHYDSSTEKPALSSRSSSGASTSRIILTTYPGQSGIDPLVMNWGHQAPNQRGPVVVSRSQSTIRRRNGTPPRCTYMNIF